jgi:hypothetical protein
MILFHFLKNSMTLVDLSYIQKFSSLSEGQFSAQSISCHSLIFINEHYSYIIIMYVLI